MTPSQCVRPRVGAILSVALAMLAGCGQSAKQQVAPANCGPSATAAAAVTGPGPFHVGYREFPLTYQAPGIDQPRTINVHVWYPTTASGGEGAQYIGLFDDPDSQVNAPPAPPVDCHAYPLMAFSHGSQAFGGSASHMMKYFASHGWVGVAPDHTGNTLVNNIDPQPTSMIYLRPLDVKLAIDAVTTLAAPDPLANKIASDKILMVGHSVGASTPWAAGGTPYDMDRIRKNCAAGDVPSGVCTDGELAEFAKGNRDERVVAAVAMAGTWKREWFGDLGFNKVLVPILDMSGSANDVNVDEVWPLVSGINFTWIELAGGCHETFNLGSCATLDVPLGFSIVDSYALAFARYHVLGDRDATVVGIVNGTAQVSDKVTFRKK